jgi:hypothetical protein
MRRHFLVAALLFAAARPAMAESEARPTLKIGGFADFGFWATDQSAPGATSGFKEGQFVLHFTSVLAPRFSFFGELSMNAHDDGFTPELERTILKFQAHDMLALSFGRYHTPINWWNVAFHHGQWLQTTINRPDMVAFGGDFIPVHFVGAVANGVVPAAGVDLGYEVGVGNGRAEFPSRAGDAGDVNNNRAWFTTLNVRPDRLYPLEVGGGFYQDLVETAASGAVDEQIASGHVTWTRETPELISEIAYIHHEARATPDTYDNWAGYVQAAYRLPMWGGRWKPYARLERMLIADTPGNPDPVFQGTLADHDLLTTGLRWDCSDFVAVKGEYQLRHTSASDTHAMWLQVAFVF